MGPPAPAKPRRRLPATGFRGAPGPGMLSPAARAGEREAAAGTPEGAGPAPAAPRALCPGLPSRETVQDSQDQKREQIRKELRGGARRYVSGEGGGGRTWLFRERGVGKAAEAREPGAFTPPPGGAAAASRTGPARTFPRPSTSPTPGLQPQALQTRRPTRPARGSGAGQLRGAGARSRPQLLHELQSPNLPAMVGRWHARLRRAPLHRGGEDAEGAEEELGRESPRQPWLRMEASGSRAGAAAPGWGPRG